MTEPVKTEPGISGEEGLIQVYLAPLAAGYPGAYGLADDCATIAPPAGHELVVTTDALVRGVHFLADENPDAIAWKALAVNISDLAAKGARPLAYLLALSLPQAPTAAWMRAFADGLSRAQDAFGCVLVGGDTDHTPGHLALTITAFGSVPTGGMVRRDGANPGDAIYVSGSIGDSTLGLHLLLSPGAPTLTSIDGDTAAFLVRRHRFPAPRVPLIDALAASASAAMDISDGLAKDLDRLARASGVGATVELPRIPLSDAARTAVAAGMATIADLVTGGEDYEILCTIPPARSTAFEQAANSAGVPVTRIGTIVAGASVVAHDDQGRPFILDRKGWDHF
jgi:thiamine-monophosphate kinase